MFHRLLSDGDYCSRYSGTFIVVIFFVNLKKNSTRDMLKTLWGMFQEFCYYDRKEVRL